MLILTLTGTAFAAGPPNADSEESMAMLLVALFMIGVAYLLAHFVVDRLQRRYLFVSGVEYILLGVGLSFFHIFQQQEHQLYCQKALLHILVLLLQNQ